MHGLVMHGMASMVYVFLFSNKSHDYRKKKKVEILEAYVLFQTPALDTRKSTILINSYFSLPTFYFLLINPFFSKFVNYKTKNCIFMNIRRNKVKTILYYFNFIFIKMYKIFNDKIDPWDLCTHLR